MKLVKMFLVAGSLFAAANAQIDTTQQHYWMMTYFISTQEGGCPFSLSAPIPTA